MVRLQLFYLIRSEESLVRQCASERIDVNLGDYHLATASKGGADWQFKFGISFFF